MMADVFVLSAVRTPIGRFGGALSALTPVQLGALAVEAALARGGVDAETPDLLVLGLARQAGVGPNPARQVSIRAGLPHRVPAYTINQACGSGMAAIARGAEAIMLGQAQVVVAAGAESLSQVPYLLPQARFGRKMGHQALVDAMYQDGYHCPLAGQVMGETVEALARRYGLSREEQDRFAMESHRKAARAWAEGRFQGEIVPVALEGARLDTDEQVKADTDLAGLGRLRPAFDAQGTLTAGNSSGITDGAAAVVLASGDLVRARGLRPLARYVAGWAAGVAPAEMGLGPVAALRAWQARTGETVQSFDLFELNEAFAAQVLACDRELGLPPDRLNVNGGAIALGHPTGCSGARIVVTLVHELRRRGLRRGLATLCVSGGQGLAGIFERVD